MKTDTAHAVVFPNRIRFFYSESKAIKTAQKFGMDYHSFDKESVKQWLGVKNDTSIRIGNFLVTPDESKALCTIGKKTPIKDIPLGKQITEQIKVQGCVGRLSCNYMQYLYDYSFKNAEKRLIDIAIRRISELVDKLEMQGQYAKLDCELIYEIIDSVVNSDPLLDLISISKDDLIKTLKTAVNEYINTEDKILESSEGRCLPDSYKEDIRDKSLDDKIIRKVERWQKRCEILNYAKENDINGKIWTQDEVAKLTGSSIGLVNKIFNLYRFNNNIKPNDLFENIRGRKHNPFTIIPFGLYLQLCTLFSNYGPGEMKVPFDTWSAKAIYYYLQKEGYEIKISYIYHFCRKMDFSSKFATRKNPKEDFGEVLYYELIKFPEICRNAIKNNAIILHLDECHVIKSHHTRGYSIKNSQTIISYDQGLEHSGYTILTFIGFNGYIRTFIIEGSFNSEKFIKCLEQLKKEFKNKKVHIIMDNSPIHTSYETLGWFLSNKNMFSFDYLPRYCPRYNVVEFFNNLLKIKIKEGGYLTIEDVMKAVSKICEDYNKCTDEVKKEIQSLFLKQECSYAKIIYEEELYIANQKSVA